MLVLCKITGMVQKHIYGISNDVVCALQGVGIVELCHRERCAFPEELQVVGGWGKDEASIICRDRIGASIALTLGLASLVIGRVSGL